jgi:hypothetical protein
MRCASSCRKRRATNPKPSSCSTRSRRRCAAGRCRSPARPGERRRRICRPGQMQLRDVGDLVSAELIRMGAREWGGIGDDAGTAPGPDARPGDALAHRDRRRIARRARSTTCWPTKPSSTSWIALCPARRRAARGKKRIVRLAEWHFGGGDAGQRYCQLSCKRKRKGRCEECPYKAHALQTDDGEGVWQVLTACQRQLRTAGMAGFPSGWTSARCCRWAKRAAPMSNCSPKPCPTLKPPSWRA